MAGSTDDSESLKSDSMELMNMDGDNDADDLDNLFDYYDQGIYENSEGCDENLLLISLLDMYLPPGEEASVSWFSDFETEKKESGTSSSTVDAESSSSSKVEDGNDDYTTLISQFKQFDVVEDFSCHFNAKDTFSGMKPPKNWTKVIQKEWKILIDNLPETIFVRVYGNRMELLRAAIVGPSGTPYHDGLFFFDCLFPADYPNSPPSVHYHSGGLEINPNLYSCGKVCLSLLGTWTGSNNENWVVGKSTMLQVLVSIQALILNSRPFFNEPGYEKFTGTTWEKKSSKYNEDVFISSLKTMIYTLQRPPKHFEELVGVHFRRRGPAIMGACKAYIKGAMVGSNIEDVEKNKEKLEGGSKEFKSAVADMTSKLLTSFLRNGMPGWEQFQPNVFLADDPS